MTPTMLLATLLLSHATASSPATAAGDGRPRVAVRFELAESTYADAFSRSRGADGEPSELELFQAETTGLVCAALKNRIGLVDFTVDSDEVRTVDAASAAGAPLLVLGVRLTSHPQPISELRPTFLTLSLEGLPPEELPPPLEWEFRTPQDFSRAIVRERFAREIHTCLERHLDARLDELVARLLCRISIAKEVYVLRGEGQVLCVLPFAYGDLKAGIGTSFRIEVERPGPLFPEVLAARVSAVRSVPLAGIELPPPFQRGIHAISAHPPQPDPRDPQAWAPLSGIADATGRLTVLRLCVLDYRFAPPILAARPADFEVAQ